MCGVALDPSRPLLQGRDKAETERETQTQTQTQTQMQMQMQMRVSFVGSVKM